MSSATVETIANSDFSPFDDGDLAAYLARIGYPGPVAPDRATLEAIAARHPATIPFENLDPLLDRPVDLSLPSLMAKLVHGGRGGYCFESNGLLLAVLRRIGFTVDGLAARVYWNQPNADTPPRTHMLLRVALADGPVLIDVGFGGAVLTGVLDLVPDVVQQTPHEPFRLLRDRDLWEQQIRIGETWRTTYRFDLTVQEPVDYELANWWTSASPQTHFRQMLIGARSVPGKRITLRNFDFAVHNLGGATERRTLESSAEVCDTLERDFAIAIPDRIALMRRLETLRSANV
ncbi:arylamine N-acetyltransferase family protein [Sphingomonas cavernae]|uniref:Arylamine N-acetyltransferase n=1 Tax=Sphingomonas cavernae TaxID=2320861 RepID=A0A418WPT9_9SPHN|nr:arylamine N-acetyltransferase [Sphingomonas cavernae]RJF93267.1 arylamine N-acetyltransferase [Sphingomonas cavernae]